MPNEKGMIIHLIVGFIKKTLHKMSQYFLKPYEPFGGDIKIKVHWFNYATKTDFKKATGVDATNPAAKSDLPTLKAEIDQIDLDKLKTTVSVDKTQLS